jgi:hypothetical protein
MAIIYKEKPKTKAPLSYKSPDGKYEVTIPYKPKIVDVTTLT